MKIDTQDIIHQEFRKIFRGYDPVEVHAFLEVIADKYSHAIQELQQTRRALQEQQQINASLLESIKNAENEIASLRLELKKIDRIVDARIDAEMIMQKARSDAEAIIEKAQQQAEQINEQIKWLQSRKERLAEDWRQYLAQQMAIVHLMTQPTDPPEMPPVKETAPSPKTDTLSDHPISAPLQDIPEKQPEIAAYLNDTELDDLPETIREAIRQSATDPSAENATDPTIADERRKKMLEELRLLNQQSTAMFRKADFEKMLGEAALKKSEDLINQIYSELEKKNPQQPSDTEKP